MGISTSLPSFYLSPNNGRIEVDGEIHNKSEIKILDQIRQEHIESRGFRVLRFSNDEILNNLTKVIKEIEITLV
jgi:very-short-patch-repair endonuclease